MKLILEIAYDSRADTYFWLRERPDGSAVDAIRNRVALIYAGLDLSAFLLLDPAIAGEPEGPAAVLAVVDQLPEQIDGVPAREALTALAQCVVDAPPVPRERRRIVEAAIETLDLDAVAEATKWAAAQLGFRFADASPMVVAVGAVAAGVPLGGLTGQRLDGRPICFVATTPHAGSTLAEAVVHEALHALDLQCSDDASLVEQLRNEPWHGSQLWHVPFFLAAGESVRRFVSSSHEDYGVTHGYYAKVPQELDALRERGILRF